MSTYYFAKLFLCLIGQTLDNNVLKHSPVIFYRFINNYLPRNSDYNDFNIVVCDKIPIYKRVRKYVRAPTFCPKNILV